MKKLNWLMGAVVCSSFVFSANAELTEKELQQKMSSIAGALAEQMENEAFAEQLQSAFSQPLTGSDNFSGSYIKGANDASESSMSSDDDVMEMDSSDYGQSEDEELTMSAIEAPKAMNTSVDIHDMMKSMSSSEGAQETGMESAFEAIAEEMSSLEESYKKSVQAYPGINKKGVFTLRRLNTGSDMEGMQSVSNDSSAMIGTLEKGDDGKMAYVAYNKGNSTSSKSYNDLDELKGMNAFVYEVDETFMARNAMAWANVENVFPNGMVDGVPLELMSNEEIMDVLAKRNEGALSSGELNIHETGRLSEKECLDSEKGCVTLWKMMCTKDNGEGGFRGSPEWVAIAAANVHDEKIGGLNLVKVRAIDLTKYTKEAKGGGDCGIEYRIGDHLSQGRVGLPFYTNDEMYAQFNRSNSSGEARVQVSFWELDSGDRLAKLQDKFSKVAFKASKKFLDKQVERGLEKGKKELLELRAKMEKKVEEYNSTSSGTLKKQIAKNYVEITEKIEEEINENILPQLTKSLLGGSEKGATTVIAEVVASTSAGFFGKFVDWVTGAADDHVGSMSYNIGFGQDGRSIHKGFDKMTNDTKKWLPIKSKNGNVHAWFCDGASRYHRKGISNIRAGNQFCM